MSRVLGQISFLCVVFLSCNGIAHSIDKSVKDGLADAKEALRKETYYSWDYTVEKDKIVLDLAFWGDEVPLVISGDTMSWKGSLHTYLDHLTFRRVK
jgi:hypothetical protein